MEQTVYRTLASVCLCGACMLWAVGCGEPLTGDAPGSSITPRSQWQASGNLSDAAAAVDGRLSTAAKDGQGKPAHLLIDLRKPCVFNTVRIEHGEEPMGFPRRVALLTSLDGQTFSKVREVPGTRKVTNIVLVTPILARYVRLEVVEAGAQPWSVGEVIIK